MQTATLDRLGRNLDRALNGIQDAWERTEHGDIDAAREHYCNANEACQAAHLAVLTEGAAHLNGTVFAPVEIPLALLDTPATRRLLDAAEFLVSCARDVDRERGFVTGDGEPCGITDSAEDLLHRVRSQVLGPKGRD